MAQDSELPDLDEEEHYSESPIDNLPARLVGDWSEDKHYYLGHFIEIFSTGMHKKWPSRAYVDLFAGPGVCMFRKTRKITDGSPLLALKAAHPFTQYFFSDLDATAVSALRKRCAPFKDKAQVEVFQKDCNAVVADIAAKIKPGALCLAFLDPTNLALKFKSIETLSKGKAMDLLIHFPHGTTIKRNIEKFYAKDKSTMDDFFGGTEWRAIYERSSPKDLTNELLRLYQAKLTGIGYRMEPAQGVLIKNTNNVPLYALLFATKHDKGMDFWKKIKQIESKGQRELPGL